MKSRPIATGWDPWLQADSLVDELNNPSSLFHRGFYDPYGQWREKRNEGFSFHFYGVLQQLSGITPRFEHEGGKDRFRIANAHVMAHAAKRQLCATHVVGLHYQVAHALDSVMNVTESFAHWTPAERSRYLRIVLNKTPGRSSRNVEDHLDAHWQRVISERLRHEIDVYGFAVRLFVTVPLSRLRVLRADPVFIPSVLCSVNHMNHISPGGACLAKSYVVV
ncbi:hypothetical protein BWQ96_05047 [Gracilariopsis chorda]|uniref:Uncharacterized protein n=1 Tax=Gracilariopsis chorda TaxID=448386 RepID=A0A2V3IU09_9FLOR|nr:hypothetical protein BWQ96_05047 [Gracilariopsis chorda]|eukprot:PXF45217.1 hypothetical protein BWQ96_05047 [Gracilariopsis chorda]